MIRNRNCGGAFVNGTPRVFGSENTLDHDRTAPRFANPTQIAPRYGGFRKARAHVNERHRTFARKHDIGERGQAAIK